MTEMQQQIHQVWSLSNEITDRGMKMDKRVLDLIGTLIHFKLTDDQISEIDSIINR